ncbi:glycosyltransferase family 4 protein [Cyclobacterium plantarum]|uniref:Glycosyltransferase family 4 protein n=1 Tax=Cyclobacterium plantarum TaxID=2716263 RepID=A0ABX0H2Z8_9BACT|nr:glycosyltransferase family 4 protein [Cyclobacterium plantarum]NHE55872.1 glycosyltransferase family 4 protein [Cyclobacterium plantarum]
MKKKKVLFITPFFPSFVLSDIQILRENFKVNINHYPWQHKHLAPVFFFLQFFSVLFNSIRVDAFVVSFGGYWSVWPAIIGKIFRKKTYIILHGTDCASIPELNYGSLRLPLLKAACRYSYRYSSCLLPVSESLTNTYLDFDQTINHKSQGIYQHFPNLKTRIITVHNGFDPEIWPFKGFEMKPAGSFIAVMSKPQYQLKGGDLIEEVATLFPNLDFKIAGMDSPEEPYPANLHFLGKLQQQKLSEVYRNSRYYLQLSSFEGFGCALAEAMLSGCIPIGSSVNHIPYIIADYGLILPQKNKGLLQKAINQLLSLDQPEEMSRNARRHIIETFPISLRKEKISHLLDHYEEQN